MTDTDLHLMMLDIDGVLTRHHATTSDVLAAAQQMAVSAVGDLTNAVIKREESESELSGYPEREQGRADRLNKGTDQIEALHRAADAIADQIRAALHARIDEGHRPDW